MKIRSESMSYLDLENDVAALCTHERNCPLLRKTADFNPLKMGDRFNYWVHGMPVRAKSNIMTAMTLMEITSLADLDEKRRRGDIIWRYTSEAPTERVEISSKDRDANYAMKALTSMCIVTNQSIKEIIKILKDNYFGEHNPRKKDRWNLGILIRHPIWTRIENMESIYWTVREEAEKFKKLLENGEGSESPAEKTLDGNKIIKESMVKTIDQILTGEKDNELNKTKEQTNPEKIRNITLGPPTGEDDDIFIEAFSEEKDLEAKRIETKARRLTLGPISGEGEKQKINSEQKENDKKHLEDEKNSPRFTKRDGGKQMPSSDSKGKEKRYPEINKKHTKHHKEEEPKTINTKRKFRQMEDMTIRQLKQRILEIAEEEKSLKEEREAINRFIRLELGME